MCMNYDQCYTIDIIKVNTNFRTMDKSEFRANANTYLYSVIVIEPYFFVTIFWVIVNIEISSY